MPKSTPKTDAKVSKSKLLDALMADEPEYSIKGLTDYLKLSDAIKANLDNDTIGSLIAPCSFDEISKECVELFGLTYEQLKNKIIANEKLKWEIESRETARRSPPYRQWYEQTRKSINIKKEEESGVKDKTVKAFDNIVKAMLNED